MKIFESIFKRGYIRGLKTYTTKDKIKRLLLYMGRWQLSTPILAIVMAAFSALNYWLAAFLANIVGSLVFYWIDKLIFKPDKHDDCEHHNINKVNKTSKKSIETLTLSLKKELVGSISNMINGKDNINLNLPVDSSSRITGLECYYVFSDKDRGKQKLKNITVSIEWLDPTDWLYYTSTKDLQELTLNELNCLWEYFIKHA